MGGISERGKEIKRRRHRRKKLTQLSKRLKKATVSEKAVIVAKLRNLTPARSDHRSLAIDREQSLERRFLSNARLLATSSVHPAGSKRPVLSLSGSGRL